MTPKEIKENVGRLVTINGIGDNYFESEMRPFIDNRWVLEIVKLTKGGNVHLKFYRDPPTEPMRKVSFLTVSPKNCDLYESIGED